MRVPNILKSIPTALLSSLIILMLGLPSMAMATKSSAGGSSPPFATLCEGDCGENAIIDSRRAEAGFADDFSLGLKLVRDGLDLTLKSDGNILLVGALVASGTIDIRADASISIGPDIVFDDGDLIIGGGFFVGDVHFRPTDGVIVNTVILSDVECDCSVLTSRSSEIRLLNPELRSALGIRPSRS